MNNSDLIGRRTGRSVGIVFFCLGMAGALDDGGANASLVLAIASQLGLAESACRTAILRLRRQGLVRSEPVGRSARYQASPAIATAQRRWVQQFVSGPGPWDGTFAGLLHDFEEPDRVRRDAFRHAARQVGYGLLRPGLLISPDDRWGQLADRFASDEHGGRIVRVGLTVTSTDPRKIARQLWGLDELARRYRAVAAEARRALAADPDPSESPIARLYRVTEPIYDVIATDPALPAALLPDDWPAAELGAALAAANEALGPAAAAQALAIRDRLGNRR